MYVRCEAVLSSQIEGAQSTLEDMLNYELTGAERTLPGDIVEVVNDARGCDTDSNDSF